MFLEVCKCVLKDKNMLRYIANDIEISSDDSVKGDSDEENSREENSGQENFDTILRERYLL